MRKNTHHRSEKPKPKMTPALIRFTKMHGTGNDFVVLDTLRQHVQLDAATIRRIAHRQLGIGCDQVLVVSPPSHPTLDFDYRIFNADGVEVEQCGNGARCFGRYVRDQGFTDKTQIKVGTRNRTITVDTSDLASIEVNMGSPLFAPKGIPLSLKEVVKLDAEGRYKIRVLGGEREVTILSLGNPHCIISVPVLKEAPVHEIGSALQSHPAFPKGVNITFMQVLARNHIRCRVFERGVGETLACGTGACAAVVAGTLLGELNRSVKVDMPGGALIISWEPNGRILLRGPTTSVFHGQFSLAMAEEVY